jgi:GST-like protein
VLIAVDVTLGYIHFVKLNPNAKVPVIVDGDGPGGKPYTCFESGAILLYLAEKTGKFLSKDMATKYDEIQWLMTQMSTVGPMFGQFVHFVRFAPAGNEYSRSRYLTQAIRVSDVIEQRLNHHAYLGGEHYSIADMATYPWSRNLPAYMDAPSMPSVSFRFWFTRIDCSHTSGLRVRHAVAGPDGIRWLTPDHFCGLLKSPAGMRLSQPWSYL